MTTRNLPARLARASLLLVVSLITAFAARATDAPAPPAIADPHDAIQQLRGEREKAETCLKKLRDLGDAYAIAQGELAYEVARMHMDEAQSGLQAALAGDAGTDSGTDADNTLESRLTQAIDARIALCALLDGLLPDTSDQKGPLSALMLPTQVAGRAAIRILLAERSADLLDRKTIATQLEGARWTDADELWLPRIVGGVPAAVDGALYPVWFGTNRRPDARHPGKFTNKRARQLSYGRADVFVPKAHRFGETGSSWWTRIKRFDLRDDQLRLRDVSIQDRDTWIGELRARIDAARDGDGDGEAHALIYLHGFNNNFEDAAIRAAQMGVDLDVNGATAFFSWPSRGGLAAYPADEATIQASEAAIVEFLVEFSSRVQADKVHLIAHSMGNRGLLRALQRIAAEAEVSGKVRFGQIFLAAPDLDRDLFIDLADLYPRFSERTTLYASDGDLALQLSGTLHDAPRAGYFSPYTVVPGIDTVAVPDFNIDLLGHAYFAQAEALLNDIHQLMRHNDAPSRRLRLSPKRHGELNFWEMGR